MIYHLCEYIVLLWLASSMMEFSKKQPRYDISICGETTTLLVLLYQLTNERVVLVSYSIRQMQVGPRVRAVEVLTYK